MRFGVYLPPQAEARQVPLLYWLSGLTCTEENFIVKAGAQRIAAELGIALVVPDTSPRGLDIPGEAANYDFGLGAGFYVDATEAPWSQGYRMYSYVVGRIARGRHRRLSPGRVACRNLRPFDGGTWRADHRAQESAALQVGFRLCADLFADALSMGRKGACPGILATTVRAWREYDATALIEDRGWRGPPLLVDQGTKDPFLDSQLKPELLRAACIEHGVPLELRMQDGYDHSYFFISSFVEDHLRFHARHL